MPRRANTQTQQEAVQENAAVQANTGADMQIEAAITKTQPEKGVLALADVKIGDFMTIRNVRIKEDDYGLTVAMPKTKAGANEQYKDTVFFADRGIKEKFDQTVQKAYETFMHQQTDLDEEPEEAEELEQEESDQAGFLFFCPVFGGGHGYEDKDHPGLAGRSGGTYQHAATGTAQSFGSSCRTAAAPRRDYHRRNRRRGCETHGGMRPGSWSEPSAYGTVSCIVPAGAVACGREHGQKKEQKETKRGEGTGIPACSVSFCRNADWYLDRRLKN